MKKEKEIPNPDKNLIINLGNQGTCTLTGFTGTIVKVIYDLNGTIQYGIRPKNKQENKMEPIGYIDYFLVEVIPPKRFFEWAKSLWYRI